MRTIPLWISILAACGGSAPATKQGAGGGAAELSPALAPLAWWLGDWEAETGSSSEHWVAAAGAIYGISLQAPPQFEVMIVDDGEQAGQPDGVLRFISMPGGKRSIEYRQRKLGERSALFGDDDQDPKLIRYFLEGEALRETLTGSDEHEEQLRFRRVPARPAPELEAADRAFAADTARRGAEGWVAAFDPEGRMPGDEGSDHDWIAEHMRKRLAEGRLEWAPIASGRNESIGYTVGKATFTARQAGARARSSYVTIWRRQADGSWKVLFDTGRAVQE
jgi:hypothetical protein